MATIVSSYETSHTEREFWRESTQEWVPRVLMIFHGPRKDKPTKWRHRIVITTVEQTGWQEGKGNG